MEASNAIRASKKALRKSIADALKTLSQDAVAAQSQRATSKLLSMQEYDRAKRLSVYLSMESRELQTSQIVVDALQRGKKVFVPYVHRLTSESAGRGDTTMDMMALSSIDEFRSLQRDNWGIPVLPKQDMGARENCFGGRGLVGDETAKLVSQTEAAAGLDLVVVPGMAFDSQFGRLGHGKGYYDKFFERYRHSIESNSLRGEMPKLVALALSEQVLPDTDKVPTTSHDWLVDAIVTGNGDVMYRR